MMVSFFWMPLWHIFGKQNASSESYKVTTDQYAQLAGDFIQQYQVKDENGNPVDIVLVVRLCDGMPLQDVVMDLVEWKGASPLFS